ncbi:MAG: putative adenosine monophosphate-protein transferase Fic [Halomonadaceae bacterium]|jgi:cell filamentation protein|uniref:putative adenosine monophosphate-protein transferase Fic n=1 Tax=Halomonas sp. MCCC 1A11062 TaxID=2733485 RepID=UPI001F38164A|nr:putative adenosine monophosphate-protein transferase Fic [Halomonas sp. MCCC 1A11062]MCE8039343.1 putative adenosine monophosphate-protein transferase Fic [Halomonas sp. MCCC 1A11062]
MDKYGVGQDPYCYDGTNVFTNLLEIRDDAILQEAERELTIIAADGIPFTPPPYDFDYLKTLHRQLFRDLYLWAGEIRTIDISKGDTRFCHCDRIEPEAKKLFDQLVRAAWYTGLERDELIVATAEFYGDLNVLHPFRDGNGRAQRILFEHLIINCGYEISWAGLDRDEWIRANIAAYHCDYDPMVAVFRQCIGAPLTE